jgi:myo-inositol-1-phosphate synthase
MQKNIKVAIAGVGNCASALEQAWNITAAAATRRWTA